MLGIQTHIEILAPWTGFAGQAFIHITAHWRFPETAVRRVDGEFLRSAPRHADIRGG
jgi:hypothetical protein